MRHLLPIRGLLILLGTAGCAPPSGLLVEPDTPYGRLRGCAPEAHLESLPSPAALVDEVGLTAAISELYGDSDFGRGSVTLTMWYEPDGSNSRRDVILHTVPPGIADAVQNLVFASLLIQPEREDPWGVRLEITIEDEIDYVVGRREYCPPRPRDPDLETSILRAATLGTRSGNNAGWVFVQVTVHRVGYVADARVIRGGLPGSSLERRLYEFVRQYSFEPARLDGIAVTGQTVVPVRVRR